MKDITLIFIILASAVTGYLLGRFEVERAVDNRFSYAQSLCRDGLVSYHQGDFFCFTERSGVKQWRPRWDRAYIVSDH